MDSVIDGIGPDNAHRVLDSILDEELQLTADLPPGIACARRDGYQPLHEIGRGAGHVAWRCFDTRDDLDVVVKTIVPEVEGAGDAAVQMLLAESAILQPLSHPGIVRSIRTGGKGSSSYLAVHFIVGLDLARHCHDLGLGTDARLGLLVGALEALAHLHRNGIVHGDIKPDHYILAEQDQPVLIDFGLASHVSQDREAAGIPSGHIGGTPPYLAPEVRDRRQHTPTPEADVYAFGMTMRAVLDGCAPGRALRRAAKVADRATQELPEARYPDAGAMLTALQSARRRYPRPRTLVGAGLLAAMMAGVLIALVVTPTPPATQAVASGPALYPEPDERPYGDDPFQGDVVHAVRMDPTSGVLAWLTTDDETDELVIQTVAGPSPPRVRGLASAAKSLDISPDGRSIVVTFRNGNAQIISVESEVTVLVSLPYPITEAWYSDTAQSLYCWSIGRGVVAQIDTTGALMRETPVRADYIQRDPDDRQLFFAVRSAALLDTDPASIDIIRLGDGLLETLEMPAPGYATAIDFNPAKGVFAVGTSTGSVHARHQGTWRSIDLGTPVPVRAIHSDGFVGIWGEVIEVDWASDSIVARYGDQSAMIASMQLELSGTMITTIQANGIRRWQRNQQPTTQE